MKIRYYTMGLYVIREDGQVTKDGRAMAIYKQKRKRVNKPDAFHDVVYMTLQGKREKFFLKKLIKNFEWMGEDQFKFMEVTSA